MCGLIYVLLLRTTGSPRVRTIHHAAHLCLGASSETHFVRGASITSASILHFEEAWLSNCSLLKTKTLHSLIIISYIVTACTIHNVGHCHISTSHGMAACHEGPSFSWHTDGRNLHVIAGLTILCSSLIVFIPHLIGIVGHATTNVSAPIRAIGAATSVASTILKIKDNIKSHCTEVNI